MNRKPPLDGGWSQEFHRRDELEKRYDRLHGAILRTAWDIRHDQYEHDLDQPPSLPINEEIAAELQEYLDVSGADYVDFGDCVRGTLTYFEVDYLVRIVRDPSSEYGIRADWKFWQYSV